MTEWLTGPFASGTQLPTGDVTFLFTDIEGSTRLVQQVGERWPEMLAVHDAILRDAIRSHGGVEVSTEGDAFFAVFTSARAAAGAAVAAQQALTAARWPGGAAIRVRMGLHSGQGMLGGDNYAGIDVHRAARVASAANGSQILASDATRALLEGTMGRDLTLHDLGAFRLKDLDEPMRLHELTADDLPGADERRPPRATRLGTLPMPRTSFVGRGRVLQQLDDLLVGTRLLVLTGPGGSGKTRLGIELARRVADSFPDGAYFVALETITDARLVPSVILQTLDVPAGTRSAEEVLREAITARRMLLVLDNLEQISGAGAMIDAILESAPDVKLVVTTRSALHVYGEQEYLVPPLGLPDRAGSGSTQDLAEAEGPALFVERARAVRPSFELTDANARTVAEICRRLDGLPLAIELAAARIRMLSPEAILARLGERLSLLEEQAPNLPARQRSLRGAIEWSYELLSVDEQWLTRHLSVFAGGWDLTAAEAVCRSAAEAGGEVDVFTGIGSLLDKSLVYRQEESADDSEPRFAMLQTIQDFGRERLSAAGELERVGRAHAEHVKGLIQTAEPEFIGADPRATLVRIGRDLDNLRAAISWCIQHDAGDVGLSIGAASWRLWQLRGLLAEGRRYLEAVLELPSAAAPTVGRGRALSALGGILYWLGSPAMEDAYREALRLFEANGDEAGVAEAYSNLGFFHLTTTPPDPAEAQRHFGESMHRYEALGDRRMVASLTGSIAYTDMALGRLEQAVAGMQHALELNLAGGYRGRAADNRFGLGNAYRRMDRFVDAAASYRAALEEALAMQDEARRLTYLLAVASLAAETDRLPEAVRLVSAVRRVALERGGSLSGAPGIIDPLEAARGAGMSDDEMAINVESGERIDLDEATAFAFTLLDAATPSPPEDEVRTASRPSAPR